MITVYSGACANYTLRTQKEDEKSMSERKRKREKKNASESYFPNK
jgi:hypothetical protein